MRNAQDNAAHTCSYSCDRPECIKAQRDELAAAAAQEAVAWVPPSFFDKGVVAATARRKPPSETAVAMRGEYVPLYAAPVTAQEAVVNGCDLVPDEVLSAIAAVAVIASKESPHPVQKHIEKIASWLYAAPVSAAPAKCPACASATESYCCNCGWASASTTAAPGVDMEAVRELLARRLWQWRTHIPTNPDAPSTRAILTYDPKCQGQGETDYNNDVGIWREACSVLDEALALIDASPKDGNDTARLDSGMIRLSHRDEFGEDGYILHTGVNLRAAIDAAMQYQASDAEVRP